MASRRAGLFAVLLALGAGGCAFTPVPLTDQERRAEASADLAAAFAEQAPLRHPLTLREAFARAIAYNLDHRVKLIEAAIASNDLDISRYDMLPKLVASAGYTWRDRVDASSSRSVLTGQQSLEPSTSTDRNRRMADLTASWNILDFAVSYYTARQNADRILVAEEQRRRVMHNLLQEVRRAYWRAASAQALAGRVRAAVGHARSALVSASKIETEGLKSPADALRYQKALLELLRDLEIAEAQLVTAKSELAALINLPPGMAYAIAVTTAPATRLARPTLPMRELEDVALLRNPDLREASYQQRISAAETRKVIARLLPSLSASYGPNWDSNSFLYYSNWYSAALRLSGNVINLLQLPAQYQRAENQVALVERRREALSVAVLAKLHLSYQQYLAAAREFEWASQLAAVDRRLFQQAANRTETDAQSELEKVSAEVSAVVSDLRRYQSYADAQAALGRLYAAVGVDPVTEQQAAALDIDDLRRALKAARAAPMSLAAAAAAAPAAPRSTASAGLMATLVAVLSPAASSPERGPSGPFSPDLSTQGVSSTDFTAADVTAITDAPAADAPAADAAATAGTIPDRPFQPAAADEPAATPAADAVAAPVTPAAKPVTEVAVAVPSPGLSD